MTGEVWQDKPPLRLTLNKAISDDVDWQCEHYTGGGVMKLHESGAALARVMGVSRCAGYKPNNVLSGLEHLRTQEYVGEPLRMTRTERQRER